MKDAERSQPLANYHSYLSLFPPEFQIYEANDALIQVNFIFQEIYFIRDMKSRLPSCCRFLEYRLEGSCRRMCTGEA